MAINVNGTNVTKVSIGETSLNKVYARIGESGAYVLVFSVGGIRVIYFAGNWKMNKIKSEIDSFFETFNTDLTLNGQKSVIIFPPACYLDYVKSKIAPNLSGMVSVGIQDISAHKSGAYTGQISANMAKDCGCSVAMIGEAEVREYFGDTNAVCGEKLAMAMQSNLKAIYCVGENLSERDNGQTQSVIETQLSEALGDLYTYLNEGRIMIAYEPLWAIGTGKIATPQDLEDACEIIRLWIRNHISMEAYGNSPVLAGGSVTPANIQQIIAMPDINGGLVGGASTYADRFAAMINEVQ